MYNRIFGNKIASLFVSRGNALNIYTSFFTCNGMYAAPKRNSHGTPNDLLSINTDLYSHDDDENIEEIHNLKAILSIPNDPKQLYKSEDSRNDLIRATKLASTMEQITKHDVQITQTSDISSKTIPQRLIKELSTLITRDPPEKSTDFEYLIDYIIPYHDIYTISLRLSELLLKCIELSERKKSQTIKSDILPSSLHFNKLLSSVIVLSSPYACISILNWISSRDLNSAIEIHQPHSPSKAISRTCKIGFQLIKTMLKYEIPFDPIIPTFLLWNSKSHPDGPELLKFLPYIENHIIFPISSTLSTHSQSLSTDAYNSVLLDILRRKDIDSFDRLYSKVTNPNEMTLSLYHDYLIKKKRKEESIELAMSLIQTESFHKYPILLLRILQRYGLIRDFATMNMLLNKILLHVSKDRLSPTFELDVLYSLASLFDCNMLDFQQVLDRLVLSKPEILNTTEYLLLLYKNTRQELFTIIFHNDLGSFPLHVIQFFMILVTSPPICYDSSGAFTNKVIVRLEATLKAMEKEKNNDNILFIFEKSQFPILGDLISLVGSNFTTINNNATIQVIELLFRSLVDKGEYATMEKLVQHYYEQDRLKELLISSASVRGVLYSLISRKAWDYVLIVLDTLAKMDVFIKDEAIQDPLLSSLVVQHRPALYYYAGILLNHCISARSHIRKWTREKFLAKDSALTSDLITYMKTVLKVPVNEEFDKFEKIMKDENILHVRELRMWLDNNTSSDKSSKGACILDSQLLSKIYSVLEVPSFVRL